jgi:hypothetical protein
MRLVDKASHALKPGGKILLEVHTLQTIQRFGTEQGSWSAATSGLFSPRPHLLLKQGYWDEAQQAATRRYFVIDAETGAVRRYAASYQGYSDQAYLSLLEAHGFTEVRLLSGMGGGFPGLRFDRS